MSRIAGSSFSVQISNFVNKTNKNIVIEMQKIAMDAFASVIFMTPVKTGRAKGNWQATVGVPARAIIGLLDPSGGIATGKAAAIVKQFKTGQVIYLINNLSYIRALEYGHSRLQAPQGMVRVTMQRVRNSLK